MSTASEKLKALLDVPGWPDPDFSQQEGDRIWAAIVAVVEAHEALVARHVSLVESGDCGFWNVEEEASMIASRAALATLEGALS